MGLERMMKHVSTEAKKETIKEGQEECTVKPCVSVATRRKEGSNEEGDE